LGNDDIVTTDRFSGDRSPMRAIFPVAVAISLLGFAMAAGPHALTASVAGTDARAMSPVVPGHARSKEVEPPAAPEPDEAGEEGPGAEAARTIDPDEMAALAELLGGKTWARRALGVMRLESMPSAIAGPRLAAALADPAWQVRSFAAAVSSRRGELERLDERLKVEPHPLVVRTLLRGRARGDEIRLARGIEQLLASGDDAERLLGVELALASGLDALAERAEDVFVSIVLRMTAAEAGRLSPRLAEISRADDLRRDHRWRSWLRRNRGRLELDGAWLRPARTAVSDEDVGGASREPAAAPIGPPNAIAALEPRSFVGLVEYVRELAERRVDLAVAIDCTASMSGELAEVQGGLDDLMLFVGDVCADLRIGVVAYRDRRDRFETLPMDFTGSLAQARTFLWRLTAEGGGDRPEAVRPALERLFREFSWSPDRTGVVVLVGDAPPHPGHGAACIDLAKRAAAVGITTHAISAAPPLEDEEAPARGRRGPPEHFPEIAAAGGGRLVELAEDDSLVAEIAGLTIGGRFEEALGGFFEAYLAVCR
jgi:Mg-chelatase subunit ChlD